jgi:hypothetical protein
MMAAYLRRTKEQEREFRKLAALCGIYIGTKKREWRKGFHHHERKCSG